MNELNEQQQLLLVKALDGELSTEERRAFDDELATNDEFRREWSHAQALKEVTSTMKFKQPSEETWDRYWAGVYARLERGLAWMLISVGAAVLLAYAGYHAVEAFLADTETPFVLKLATGAVAFGFAVLVVSVIRERWFVRKSDKYREVVR
jgi:ferric-dicitrate binding protein FerR (iron transport regulator)